MLAIHHAGHVLDRPFSESIFAQFDERFFAFVQCHGVESRGKILQGLLVETFGVWPSAEKAYVGTLRTDFRRECRRFLLAGPGPGFD